MTRQQISIRLESTKIERLKSIADNQGVSYVNLIRDKVDEVINVSENNISKARVKEIVKELREPFIYFSTDQGKKFANKERQRRERIAQTIESCFNLKRGV